MQKSLIPVRRCLNEHPGVSGLNSWDMTKEKGSANFIDRLGRQFSEFGMRGESSTFRTQDVAVRWQAMTAHQPDMEQLSRASCSPHGSLLCEYSLGVIQEWCAPGSSLSFACIIENLEVRRKKTCFVVDKTRLDTLLNQPVDCVIKEVNVVEDFVKWLMKEAQVSELTLHGSMAYRLLPDAIVNPRHSGDIDFVLELLPGKIEVKPFVDSLVASGMTHSCFNVGQNDEQTYALRVKRVGFCAQGALSIDVLVRQKQESRVVSSHDSTLGMLDVVIKQENHGSNFSAQGFSFLSPKTFNWLDKQELYAMTHGVKGDAEKIAARLQHVLTKFPNRCLLNPGVLSYYLDNNKTSIEDIFKADTCKQIIVPMIVRLYLGQVQGVQLVESIRDLLHSRFKSAFDEVKQSMLKVLEDNMNACCRRMRFCDENIYSKNEVVGKDIKVLHKTILENKKAVSDAFESTQMIERLCFETALDKVLSELVNASIKVLGSDDCETDFLIRFASNVRNEIINMQADNSNMRSIINIEVDKDVIFKGLVKELYGDALIKSQLPIKEKVTELIKSVIADFECGKVGQEVYEKVLLLLELSCAYQIPAYLKLLSMAGVDQVFIMRVIVKSVMKAENQGQQQLQLFDLLLEAFQEVENIKTLMSDAYWFGCVQESLMKAPENAQQRFFHAFVGVSDTWVVDLPKLSFELLGLSFKLLKCEPSVDELALIDEKIEHCFSKIGSDEIALSLAVRTDWPLGWVDKLLRHVSQRALGSFCAETMSFLCAYLGRSDSEYKFYPACALKLNTINLINIKSILREPSSSHNVYELCSDMSGVEVCFQKLIANAQLSKVAFIDRLWATSLYLDAYSGSHGGIRIMCGLLEELDRMAKSEVDDLVSVGNLFIHFKKHLVDLASHHNRFLAFRCDLLRTLLLYGLISVCRRLGSNVQLDDRKMVEEYELELKEVRHNTTNILMYQRQAFIVSPPLSSCLSRNLQSACLKCMFEHDLGFAPAAVSYLRLLVGEFLWFSPKDITRTFSQLQKDLFDVGYDLNLMFSDADLPTSGECSVVIQKQANDKYLVRIFDQKDTYTDYSDFSEEVIGLIKDRFDDNSQLDDQYLIEKIASDLGHTRVVGTIDERRKIVLILCNIMGSVCHLDGMSGSQQALRSAIVERGCELLLRCLIDVMKSVNMLPPQLSFPVLFHDENNCDRQAQLAGKVNATKDALTFFMKSLEIDAEALSSYFLNDKQMRFQMMQLGIEKQYCIKAIVRSWCGAVESGFYLVNK